MKEHEEMETVLACGRAEFRRERNRFCDEGAATRVGRFWSGIDVGRESVMKRENGWGVCGHESRSDVGKRKWGLSCAVPVRRTGI